MNDFEIIHQTDPSRESIHGLEKYTSIEMSDEDYIKMSKLWDNATPFVYRPPSEEESKSPILKEKLEKAHKICEEMKVINLSEKDKPS